RFLRLEQPTGFLGLRRIVVQQSTQKNVGVDSNHATRLLAVTFARLLASASRNDSSPESRTSALRCLSTPALAPRVFLRMVIRPLCSRNSTWSPGRTRRRSDSSVGSVTWRLGLRMGIVGPLRNDEHQDT